MTRWVCGILGCALALQAQVTPQTAQLEKRLTRVIANSTLLRRSTLGIHVVELATGKTLYGRNLDRMFVPASNTKLVTTSAALTRLGPEHRFKTQLILDDSPPELGWIVQVRDHHICSCHAIRPRRGDP